MQTNSTLRHAANNLAMPAATLIFIAIVSVMTPFQDPVYFSRWFNLPGSALTVLMPLAVLAAAFVMFRG